jgi:hypothetical protein
VVRAKANLRRWFDAQRRVGERLLSVRDLARTCYSDEDKMFSSVVIELMHAAVMRERDYPLACWRRSSPETGPNAP